MSAFSGGSAFFSNTPEKANKWFLILKPFLTTEEMKHLETKTRKYGRKKTPTGLSMKSEKWFLRIKRTSRYCRFEGFRWKRKINFKIPLKWPDVKNKRCICTLYIQYTYKLLQVIQLYSEQILIRSFKCKILLFSRNKQLNRKKLWKIARKSCHYLHVLLLELLLIYMRQHRSVAFVYYQPGETEGWLNFYLTPRH